MSIAVSIAYLEDFSPKGLTLLNLWDAVEEVNGKDASGQAESTCELSGAHDVLGGDAVESVWDLVSG
jgi:hypothetical protein